MIQVFERYESVQTDTEPVGKRGCQLWQDERGDLWNDIVWDFLRPDIKTINKTEWTLKCDFRLPAHGIFRFNHPHDDNQSIEFKYATPFVIIQDHIPGDLDTSMLENYKNKWDELPLVWTCKIGPMTLIANKDIPDKVEMDNLGRLYLYRPASLTITFIN